MSGLLQDCVELFDTESLYDVLGLTSSATKQELKKAYRRKSLVYHPDRVGKDDQEVATKKFQALSQVYAILSDDERRAEYDETGQVGEDISVDQDRDWVDYWRLLFPKVSLKDIQDFEEKYKGSTEELEDLKSAYLKFEGNMDDIMDNVLLAAQEDESRFTSILQDLVSHEELPDFDTFSKESKKKKNARMKKAQAEAEEAAEEAKKLRLGGEDALVAAIRRRQAAREGFLSNLEQKYAPSGNKKKKTKK